MSFNIASYIDHTLLKPDADKNSIRLLCNEAVQEQFAAICISPYFISFAKELLEDSKVKIATVIGFPLGYNSTASKMQDITNAIDAGADELDVVHNITAVKNGDWQYASDEIRQCTELIHSKGRIIKVIVESGMLTDEELAYCCEYYAPLGIDFMKTSTGFSATGATVHAVQLMRKFLPIEINIKASGGIRNFAFAQELIDAGANRIGCSASMQILKESKEALH